jgi:hypothetical protein
MRRRLNTRKQETVTAEGADAMKPFLVEVGRLADGRTAGQVTDLASGQTEVFRGWRELLSVLADDQSPTTLQ